MKLSSTVFTKTGNDPVGKGMVLTAPMTGVVEDWEAGKNDETTSIPPLSRLPALGTKTRELLGRIARCVGLSPRLGSAGSEVGVSPIMVSPATSICIAPPG